MSGACDAIGQHAKKFNVGPVMHQSVGDGAESLSHCARVNDCQHRDAEQRRQIGTGRCAIKQPHHSFDEYQVGFRAAGRAIRGNVLRHPSINQADKRMARRAFQNHRIEKIRPCFEYAHMATLAAVICRECGGNGGLALAGGGRGNQQSRAMMHGIHNSMPFCAWILR